MQVKSYLSGNPAIRVGLSENLILGKRDQRMYSRYAWGAWNSWRGREGDAGASIEL